MQKRQTWRDAMMYLFKYGIVCYDLNGPSRQRRMGVAYASSTKTTDAKISENEKTDN